MKKNLLLLVLLLVSTATFAQKRSFFQLGLKGGANLSQLRTGSFFANGQYNGQTLGQNLEQSWNSRTGFVGGVWMRLGRTLYIQPELLYSGKGGAYTVQVLDASGKPMGSPQEVKVKMQTLDVPLLLGLKLGPLRVNAGPVASLMMGADETLKDALTKYTNSNVNDTFNKAAWGYQIGGGLDFGQMSLDVRYEDGLSNLRVGNFQPNVTVSNPFQQKTRNYQVTLGFRLL